MRNIFFTIISLFVPKKDILGNMKYPEYLKSAERHLVSCQKFFDSIKWDYTDQEKDIVKNEDIILEDIHSLKKDKAELSTRKRKIQTRVASLLRHKKKWINDLEAILNIAPLLKLQMGYQSLLVKKVEQFKKEELKQDPQKKEVFVTFLKKTKDWMDQLEILLTSLGQQISWLKEGDYWLEQYQSILIKEMEQFKSDEIQLEQKEAFLKKQLEKVYSLRDIYYLTGYILEGIAVYLIYRAGEFDPEKNIKFFDKRFTEETGVDFYEASKRKYGIKRCDQEWYDLQKDICGINSHHFNGLINRYREKFSIASIEIPYVDNPNIASTSVCTLIENWDVSHRYSDSDDSITWNNAELRNHLNRETLSELINLYSKIVNTVNKVEFCH